MKATFVGLCSQSDVTIQSKQMTLEAIWPREAVMLTIEIAIAYNNIWSAASYFAYTILFQI